MGIGKLEYPAAIACPDQRILLKCSTNTALGTGINGIMDDIPMNTFVYYGNRNHIIVGCDGEGLP